MYTIPNPIYNQLVVNLEQDDTIKKHLKNNTFNFGGKVKKIGTHNELNIEAYTGLKSYLTKKRIALDIGARWGEWARIIQDDFTHVICFEPIRVKYKYIKQNCKLNNLSLYGCCLGDKLGNVPMYAGSIYDPNKPGINRFAYNKNKRTIQTSIKLDDLGLGPIDFIKIDVEGFELPVLKGGEETIKKWKPIICIEQNGSETKWRSAKTFEASNFLLSLGMKLEKQLNHQDYLFVWKDIEYPTQNTTSNEPNNTPNDLDNNTHVNDEETEQDNNTPVDEDNNTTFEEDNDVENEEDNNTTFDEDNDVENEEDNNTPVDEDNDTTVDEDNDVENVENVEDNNTPVDEDNNLENEGDEEDNNIPDDK
jgi:FkbM family methyltransferase